MAKKRKPYTLIINDIMCGNVPYKDASGKQKYLRKKFTDGTPSQNETAAWKWALAEIAKMQSNGGAPQTDKKTTISELANWYKKNFLIEPVEDRNRINLRGVKDWKRQRAKLDRITEYFGGLPVAVTDAAEAAEQIENHSAEYDGGRFVSTIDELALSEYITHRVETDNVVAATTNRDLALLRTMFRNGAGQFKLHSLPKFKLNKAGEIQRDRPVSKAEESLLLAACVDHEMITTTRKGKPLTMNINCKRSHLRAYIVTALDCALRAGEIYKLQWQDADFEKQIFTIHYFNAKVPKTRKVPMSNRVKEELLKMPNRTGTIFSAGSVKRSFATAKLRAGITDLRFHDLRHVGTSRLCEGNVPHMVAMSITGHTQMSTFRRYIDQTEVSVQAAGASLEAYNQRLDQMQALEVSAAVN